MKTRNIIIANILLIPVALLLACVPVGWSWLLLVVVVAGIALIIRTSAKVQKIFINYLSTVEDIERSIFGNVG